MAERRPLVTIAGQVQELPAGDSLPGSGGGGGIGGSAVLSFGASPGTGYVTATITDASISSASRVRVWVQGVTADHNAMQHLIIAGRMGIVAIPATGSFTIHAETELRLTGDVAVKWEAA